MQTIFSVPTDWMNSFSQVLWTAISQNALERNRKSNYKSCFHQSAAAGGSPNTLKRPKHVKRTSASWSKMLSCCFFRSCLECWAMGVTVVQYRYSIIEATLAPHKFLSFHESWLVDSSYDFNLCLEVTPAQLSGFQAGQAHPLFTSSASPIPKVLPFMETKSLTSLGHWIHHLDQTFKCPNGWCSIGPILQKQVRFLVSIRVTSRFKVVINLFVGFWTHSCKNSAKM